jgi:etoposide-induced 2.4 mRNA
MLSSIARSAARGSLDSISLHKSLVLVVRSEKIRVRLVQCLILNGFVFLGSIFIFSHMLTPLLRYLLSHLLKAADPSLTSISIIQGWIEWIYFALWIVPVYILSFVLNAIWYQDIANESIKHFPGVKMSATSTGTLTSSVVEIVFRSIFNVVFVIYLVILYKLRLVYVFNLSWLIAYNAFEYKWIHNGIPFSQKISDFETNWIYYLFFGLPLALTAVQFPSIIENGLVSLAFPFLVMSASTAGKPLGAMVRSDNRLVKFFTRWIEKAPVFFIPKHITNAIILLIDTYNKRRLVKR